MNEFEQNPDEFWRNVFDDAAETPPARVWDAIEHRLDEPDSAGIVPLWAAGFFAKRSVSWGMSAAAAVALLLVGWWLTQSSAIRQPVASNQATPATTELHQDALALDNLSRREMTTSTPAGSNAKQRNNAGHSTGSSSEITTSSSRSPRAIDPVRVSDQLARQTRLFSSRSTSTEKTSSNNVDDEQSGTQLAVNVPPMGAASLALVTQPSAAQSMIEHPDEVSDRQVLPVEKLQPHPLTLRSAGQIHRIVWVRPYEAPQEAALAEAKRSSRERWVSLSVMPNTFNPAVSVQASQPALASAYRLNIANSSQPSVKNRAELSIAYQANAGVQLNDHWSVESGVGYLAGHAIIDSPSGPFPASMLSAFNTSGISVNTLYTEVLRQSVQRNTAVAADRVVSNSWDASSAYNSLYAYDPQTRQTLTNDYQFVQVPVQVGYQLRPRKRLGLALLGGFLTNIFLRNTVDNQLVIKPENGIYQPVTLAAAMGARFQYRSTQRWSASLAGMYQSTLGSAAQPGSSIQSHPTTTGMSFGVDYHF